MEFLLLDTDIGSDIDDALCLAYLLAQPRCRLLGVTTVSGDTVKRAALADALCRAAAREDIPIHAGARGPLLSGPGQPNVPQFEALAGRPHRADFPAGTALEFLRSAIRERPGEIVLLGIGPLTNLALLFAIDPQLPSLLKELVLMCGVFTAKGGQGPGAGEWNARVDPIATAMVYAARPPRFTSIGLDVTTCCRMPADECRARFLQAGGPLKVVGEMAEIWFRGRAEITFHDPLAGAAIFEPGLCRYEDGLVRVETHSPLLEGLTGFSKPDAKAAVKDAPHRIAVEVDAAKFFAHYFETLGAGLSNS